MEFLSFHIVECQWNFQMTTAWNKILKTDFVIYLFIYFAL